MELLEIMSEQEWRLIEEAALTMYRDADFMRAESIRKRADYDLVKLNRSEV
jgi:hypothetical protein